ncbi:MAG: hypothetical protein E7128_06710 [Rikenellaceae bacterium]|nr:hypothetical protein [Rikenellaceae bacterium]
MKERLHYVASQSAAEQLIEAVELAESAYEEYVVYIEGLSKVAPEEIDAREMTDIDEWPEADIVVWHGTDADEQALWQIVASVTPAERLREVAVAAKTIDELSIEQMSELVSTND